MSRIHEAFDRYVANPIGEVAAIAATAACVAKGGYEAVQDLTGEAQINASDLFETIGYGAGALALGAIALTAANHYRGPRAHIPHTGKHIHKDN